VESSNCSSVSLTTHSHKTRDRKKSWAQLTDTLSKCVFVETY